MSIARGAGRVLIPPLCAFCSAKLESGYCCSSCADILPANKNGCPQCANPLPNSADQMCVSCATEPPPFSKAFVPYLYRFPVDDAIKAIKFRHQLFFAPPLGNAMAMMVKNAGYFYDGIVPVPLHRWRHARRGFNQARELSRYVSKELGSSSLITFQ